MYRKEYLRTPGTRHKRFRWLCNAFVFGRCRSATSDRYRATARSARKTRRALRLMLAGHLPADERDWNQARGREFVHGRLQRNRVPQLTHTFADQLFDLELADQITRAIRRLLEIEVLLTAHQVALQTGPAARRLRRRESSRLLQC